MAQFDNVRESLVASPRRWLVTGVAGFIGSNLLEFLLQHNQQVVGCDNFATGLQRNLDQVRDCVGDGKWKKFAFHESDIIQPKDCAKVCEGVDYVLHQAALGSVPRSIADPQRSNRANIDGFLNMLVAARDAKAKRFVYASSGAVYGDHHVLPMREDIVGKPLSPYAVTKCVNELYADVFSKTYGSECIGLRYFNVFGRRQNADNPYASVFPTWVGNFLRERPCVVNGDGANTRDFCHVSNVIQANVLAATTDQGPALNTVYNIAVGTQTSLLELYAMIRDRLAKFRPELGSVEPQFGPFRAGDIRHSQADISRARLLLEYEPGATVAQGLDESIPWYVSTLRA